MFCQYRRQHWHTESLPDCFFSSVKTEEDKDIVPWMTGEEGSSDTLASGWERSI